MFARYQFYFLISILIVFVSDYQCIGKINVELQNEIKVGFCKSNSFLNVENFVSDDSAGYSEAQTSLHLAEQTKDPKEAQNTWQPKPIGCIAPELPEIPKEGDKRQYSDLNKAISEYRQYFNCYRTSVETQHTEAIAISDELNERGENAKAEAVNASLYKWLRSQSMKKNEINAQLMKLINAYSQKTR